MADFKELHSRRYCCVVDCHNSGNMLKKFSQDFCSVHHTQHQFCVCPEPFRLLTFPTKKKNPELRKAWERCVNRQSPVDKTGRWEANNDSRICTRHFIGHEYPVLHMGHNNIPREYQFVMSSTSNKMDNQLKSADPGHNVSLSEHDSEHTILLENPVMINEDQIEHNVQYLRIQTSAGAEYLIHSDMAAAGEQLQNAFYAHESDGSGIYNVRTEDGHLRIDDVSEHDAQDDHLEKSEGIDMDLDDIANVNHDASHIGSQFTAQMDKAAPLPSHLSSMLTVINADSKDNSKQEALPATADEHAIKIFNTVQATLDTEFVDYISSLNSPSYLHEVSTQHQVKLDISSARNNESTYLCKGTVTALNHFEKYLYMVLYGEETYEQKFTKSVQANLESKPQLVDKCVGCDIPKPVFSRSGRQVKLKAELMESADEYYLPPAILDAPSNVPEPGKRRRGRPPKKKPKMIHVDKEAKVTVIKEKSQVSGGVKEEQNVAEGDESAVEEVTKKDGKVCADLPVKVKSERIPERVCDILEPQHEPYIQKATVERFDRHTAVDDSLKAMKKKYEDRMPFKFSCDMCSFRTKRRSHLVKHKAIHVKKNLPLLKCDKCSFSTLRNGHLSRHMLTHRTDNVKCSKCDYVTSSVKHMRFHMKKRHAGQEVELPDQPVQVQICQICKYETDRPHAMKRHMKIHEIDDGKLVYLFECKLCTYKTEKKIHFTRHMVVVHSEKRPFLCDTCGRGFKRADALKQHRVVHMSKDARSYSYFCDECHKGFRSPVCGR